MLAAIAVHHQPEADAHATARHHPPHYQPPPCHTPMLMPPLAIVLRTVSHHHVACHRPSLPSPPHRVASHPPSTHCHLLPPVGHHLQMSAPPSDHQATSHPQATINADCPLLLTIMPPPSSPDPSLAAARPSLAFTHAIADRRSHRSHPSWPPPSSLPIGYPPCRPSPMATATISPITCCPPSHLLPLHFIFIGRAMPPIPSLLPIATPCHLHLHQTTNATPPPTPVSTITA